MERDRRGVVVGAGLVHVPRVKSEDATAAAVIKRTCMVAPSEQVPLVSSILGGSNARWQRCTAAKNRPSDGMMQCTSSGLAGAPLGQRRRHPVARLGTECRAATSRSRRRPPRYRRRGLRSCAQRAGACRGETPAHSRARPHPRARGQRHRQRSVRERQRCAHARSIAENAMRSPPPTSYTRRGGTRRSGRGDACGREISRRARAGASPCAPVT